MSPHGNRGGVIFDAGNAGNANNGDTPPPPATNAGTTVRDATRSKGAIGILGESISSSASFLKSYLNPLNYYTPNDVRERDFALFMDKQNNFNTANHNYYPFTEIKPNASWLEKLELTVFGESNSKFNRRQLDLTYANSEVQQILKPNVGHSADVDESNVVNSSVMISVPNSPAWKNVSSDLSRIESTLQKLNTIPTTPKLYPAKVGSSIPWDTKIHSNAVWNDYLNDKDHITDADIMRDRDQYYRENPDNVARNKKLTNLLGFDNTTKGQMIKETHVEAQKVGTSTWAGPEEVYVTTLTSYNKYKDAIVLHEARGLPKNHLSNVHQENVLAKIARELKAHPLTLDKTFTHPFKDVFLKDHPISKTPVLQNSALSELPLQGVVNLNEGAPLADGSQKHSSSPVMDAINKHRLDSKTKQ